MKQLPRFLTILLFSITCAAAAADPVFVAVGYGGRRMSSRDGVNWENIEQWSDKSADDSNNLMGIVFGQGKFVAVGGGGWTRETQAGHILVSADGKTWREVKQFPNRVNPITFGGGRFVVGGPDKQLWWSPDGETWNAGPKIDYKGWAFWFRQGCFGNGVHVLMGNSGPKQTEYWVAVSPDGATISHFANDLPQIRDLAFGGGRFVAVGPEGMRMSSTDGKVWQQSPTNVAEDKLDWVHWTGREFVCGGGKATYKSPDGLAWQPGTDRPPCHVIAVSPRQWIGTSWPGNMWHSADGVKWEKSPIPAANGINKIAFGVPGAK